ncbi:MAG TPA: hypothetical protein VGE52_18050, partial [Pirellulales bacterium]
LPIANSQLMLSIEGSEGTGFAIVDGGLQSINPRIDLGDGPHELAVQVRELPRNEANPRAPLRVSVIADVDRRRIADWQGDVNTVETPANWISFDPSRPWLGADAPVKFTKVWLTRINLATGEIASSPVNVHRSSIAGPGGLASNSRPGTNGSGLGAFEPRPKRPAPEAAALEVAQKQVAELYAKEMAAAKTADEKAVLAHTMLNAAKDVGDDEAAQYALLDSARKWAAEGADAEALTSSLDKLNESFVIERWPLTTSSFQTAATAAKTIKQSTALASALAPLVSEAMDEELIEVAGQLAAIGSEVTRKNPDQRKVFRELQDQTAALVEQAKAAAAALKTLEENPDDPEANTAVAKHLCFVKQDWEHGIPYLLKAKEEPLRKLAVQEQAAPEDGEGAASLADGWWDLSKLATVAKADRINYQLRARHWYLAAQSRLTGLPVKRIDRRLEEIAALNLDAGGRKGGAKNALPAGAEAGMIGRIAVRGRDVGVLVRYQPGRTFTSPNLGALLNQPAVVDVRNSVMTLDGYLRMPLAGKVTIRHFCSSASGVNTTLYIDGQIINTMGDDTGKDETITRDLPSGDHMIRWEIRGFLRYIGDAGLTFTDANDRPVTLFYSLDALKQLRANSTILELEVGQ